MKEKRALTQTHTWHMAHEKINTTCVDIALMKWNFLKPTRTQSSTCTRIQPQNRWRLCTRIHLAKRQTIKY